MQSSGYDPWTLQQRAAEMAERASEAFFKDYLAQQELPKGIDTQPE